MRWCLNKGICVVVVLVLSAHPVWAHKVKCFAALEEDVITGYAWMGGGGRPQNVPYRVFGPDNQLLTSGVTDAEGRFSFRPSGTVAHRIEVEAGPGHTAVYTVPHSELAGAAVSPPGELVPTVRVGDDAAASVEEDHSGLQAAIEAAVSRQVAPLRRELAEYQSQNRMQDMLAGLGFILGITGVAFYFMGRRRFQSEESGH